MKCRNCEIQDAVKYSEFSNGEFCSKKCSRAFSTKKGRSEINEKISVSLKNGYSNNTIKKGIQKGIKHHRTGCKLSHESVNKLKSSLKNSWAKRIEKMKSDLPFEIWSIRERVSYIFKKFGNICQECGYSYINEFGKGPYEIHHIDGNNKNWKEDNLTLLCLICHWKTPNWRFRGKKHSDETKKKLSVNCNPNKK